MNIIPVSQHNHPNFCAEVKFNGCLEYVTKEMKQEVIERARNFGKSTDTINFDFGTPRNYDRESFSEQGHFYTVPPSISRRVTASIFFNNEKHDFVEKYDNKFTNHTSHENETWKLITILLEKIKNVTNPPNLSDIDDGW